MHSYITLKYLKNSNHFKKNLNICQFFVVINEKTEPSHAIS